MLGDLIDILNKMLVSVVLFWEVGFIFVLNEEIVLMSSLDFNYLSLINFCKLRENSGESLEVIV